MRYVALGDSFTLGIEVSADESWPAQLAARLAGGPTALELVENLAEERHTSADLIRDQLPRLNELDPEFVSLLVGAEDVLEDVPENAYAENVTTILDELLGRLPAERILTVAIPDFTVGAAGRQFADPGRISAAVARANEIVGVASEARGVAFAGEPFAISREAIEDPALIGADGLHPSAAQYARWVEAMVSHVERLVAA